MSQVSHRQLIEMDSYEKMERELDEAIENLPTLSQALEPHDEQNHLDYPSEKLKDVIVYIRRTDEDIKKVSTPLGAYIMFSPKKPDAYAYRIKENTKKLEGITEEDDLGCFVAIVYPDKNDPHNLDKKPEIITCFEHEDGKTGLKYYEAHQWRKALNDFFKME